LVPSREILPKDLTDRLRAYVGHFPVAENLNQQGTIDHALALLDSVAFAVSHLPLAKPSLP
jgi:hypothetical protein